MSGRRTLDCVVAGGSLVGLSAAIALSRLGIWPSPWREALALALASGTVFGTPIVHYKPRRLARGRVALAGDAAHAASPMVGGGFREGLYDVAALAQVMAGLATSAAGPDALIRYQELRLGPAVRHVTVSERATAAYLGHAAARPGT